jgi:hypothetical protein
MLGARGSVDVWGATLQAGNAWPARKANNLTAICEPIV